MPRIAVAVMVVLTIGVSIGINVARFPVVWDMVNHSPKGVLPQEPLPMPVPPAVPSQEVVDLGDFSPPTALGSSSRTGAEGRATPSPRSGPTASRSAERSASSPSSAGGSSMHLVSEPRSGTAGPLNDTLARAGSDGGAVGRESSMADSAAVGLFPGDTLARDAVPKTARPITFGPLTAATPIGRGSGGAGWTAPAAGSAEGKSVTAPVDCPEATTWPAQLAPTLKLGAKPLLGNGEFDEWREEEPMVPIHRPNGVTARAASTRDSPASSVERLPRILPSDVTTPWSEYDRRPEISKAIYPSTGQ